MSSRAHDARRTRVPRIGGRLVGIALAHAGGAVYGAVMVGVLLASEDARREGYGATIEAAVVVLALYWLTNLYAHTLGERMQRREHLHLKLFWRSCVHELPTVEGAMIPVAVLLVTWAASLPVTSGVNAALWSSAATVVVLEVAAGWRSRRGSGDLWLQIGAGAVMGLTLVGLKLVLH
jgi:prepilin signal peptidase PulO-like enzyme (type II secretory pathway)